MTFWKRPPWRKRFELLIAYYDFKWKLNFRAREAGEPHVIRKYVDVIWAMRKENETFMNEVRLERFLARAKYIRRFGRL